MKFAFYPGCVSRGGCPELYPAAVAVAKSFGIELEELTGASCTGAGALQEGNLLLGDTLNARTFAMAERLGLPIMTICSTCQGVMSQARKRLNDDPAYRAKVNGILSEEGLEYHGPIEIKHLLWVLVEDIGLETLKQKITRPLSGLRVAPFYGCYIVRPTDALGYGERPERANALETVINALGGEPVDFDGKTRCCGFPILTINERNSVAMVAKHTIEAKNQGADAMVTPC
ncbi:MAG: CoB--CoM heterodisulfide reductase iron-sulfur subunit B family protein, partial [Chloroflexi bacterium]|nr:CoB--CoM heterodisulfide reductase iron-sulfur subunit B family protein [Chloroflexota bacterium]